MDKAAIEKIARQQGAVEHIEDIIKTAETFHDERGFSTQTLYPMDIEVLKDALDLLYKPPDGPELREKIQAILSLRTDVIFAYCDRKITQGEIELFLNDIDNQLLALRIPKDKPPLLTQEEMEFILGSVLYDTYGLEPKVRRVRIEQLLQAQREICIKHYEEDRLMRQSPGRSKGKSG